jgi:hypothetical protein
VHFNKSSTHAVTADVLRRGPLPKSTLKAEVKVAAYFNVRAKYE